MRALILPAAALALASALVLVGGRMVEGPARIEPATVGEPAAEAVAAAGRPAVPTVAAPAAAPIPAPAAVPPSVEEPAVAARQAVPVEQPLAPSRTVAPSVVAPPALATGEQLLREAPREPLSKLSLALPPPPPPEFKNPWAGKPLFRPVAVESAVFESGGHTIAIDDVKSVPLDETCTYEGTSWPCGMRARAAFRMWLRGRALVCQVPDDEEDNPVMRARCRLAKQDVGAWLVSNGWALAAPDGAYVQAEEKARAARMGIFGPPPDASSIPAVPDAPVSAGESLQIMTEEGVDPQPSLFPQVEPPAGEFPPAPPPPAGAFPPPPAP